MNLRTKQEIADDFWATARRDDLSTEECINRLIDLTYEAHEYAGYWEKVGMQVSANYIGMCIFGVVGWVIAAFLVGHTWLS